MTEEAKTDVRKACNVLATYHRDSGNVLTEISGRSNPVVVFVTSDETIKSRIRGFAPLPQERFGTMGVSD